VGFFLLGDVEQSLPKMRIRHPTGMLFNLDNVLSFVGVLVVQDLEESLTVVWLEHGEKLSPAGREKICKRHIAPSPFALARFLRAESLSLPALRKRVFYTFLSLPV
jgi:hypothetical protein